jgi:cytochrome c-type biogenesis protein
MTLLGVAASLAGFLFIGRGAVFAVAMAAVSVIAGSFAFARPALRFKLSLPKLSSRAGAAGAFVYGILFAGATITTSAGPLLLILSSAFATGRVSRGAALALAFGCGRDLPFLLVGSSALFVQRWGGRIDRARRSRSPVAFCCSSSALISPGLRAFCADAIRCARCSSVT